MNLSRALISLIATCLLPLALAFPAVAAAAAPTEALDGLEWRDFGPYRGGRVTAVTGVPGQPNVYFMGATGGGVWKTENAGRTWENLSDGWFEVGTIGALAVAGEVLIEEIRSGLDVVAGKQHQLPRGELEAAVPRRRRAAAGARRGRHRRVVAHRRPAGPLGGAGALAATRRSLMESGASLNFKRWAGFQLFIR